MNPRKLSGLANHDQEPWKAPLPQFIERLYEKCFGCAAPDTVRSVEELARARDEKRATRKAAKQGRRALEADHRAGAGSVGAAPEIAEGLAAMRPTDRSASD